MFIFSYLRFKGRPASPKMPPPKGCIDIFHEAESNTIKAKDHRGDEVPFSVSDQDSGSESEFQYDPAIINLTGGGSINLDGIVTAGVPVGRIQAVNVFGATLYFYALTASTASESTPNYIRPDDYGPSNQKVWVLRSMQVGNLVASGTLHCGPLTISGLCSLLPDNLTDIRQQQLADAEGTIPAVPSFADLTEANAQLSAGDFWWDTTLKKLRAATA